MSEATHLEKLIERIIACALEVHRRLGPGFVRPVYERALAREFKLRRIKFDRRVEFTIRYKGVTVGKHRCDMVVSKRVILKITAVDEPAKLQEAELASELKAASVKVGLMINFHSTLLVGGIKRVVL